MGLREALSESELAELYEVVGDDEWVNSILSNPVSVSDECDLENLRGKEGEIEDIVIPNSDPLVFHFQPSDGSKGEWLFYDDIVIKGEG